MVFEIETKETNKKEQVYNHHESNSTVNNSLHPLYNANLQPGFSEVFAESADFKDQICV